MYVSWVLADKLRIVMSSIMRWRRGEIGFVIGELLSLDCTNVQSLQTGDCLPMPSLRSSRPTGHDHYRSVRQSDSSNPTFAIGNWAAATGSLPRSGLVQRTLRNISAVSPRSLGLDVGGPDHLAPLSGFGGDEPAEVGGRAGKDRVAHIGDPRLHLGIGKNLIDDLIEHLDGLGGRILRSADPKKCARLIIWHELTHRWDIRHHFRARCCGHRQHR